VSEAPRHSNTISQDHLEVTIIVAAMLVATCTITTIVELPVPMIAAIAEESTATDHCKLVANCHFVATVSF
jgi:hypothetical protein